MRYPAGQPAYYCIGRSSLPVWNSNAFLLCPRNNLSSSFWLLYSEHSFLCFNTEVTSQNNSWGSDSVTSFAYSTPSGAFSLHVWDGQYLKLLFACVMFDLLDSKSRSLQQRSLSYNFDNMLAFERTSMAQSLNQTLLVCFVNTVQQRFLTGLHKLSL